MTDLDPAQAGTPDSTAPLQPIAPVDDTASARLSSLDVMRGVAVLGIVAANIVAFGQPMYAAMYPGNFVGPTGDADGWLWVAQFVLIDGKMRGLFSLLFGAGVYLFMERAWAKGATRWLQARRLGYLALFGLAHFFLLWRGDILLLYALSGLVALGCLLWKEKTQLVLGLLGYLAGSLLMAAMMVPTMLVADTDMGDNPVFASYREALDEAQSLIAADEAVDGRILTEGNYADFVTHNISEHAVDLSNNMLLMLTETLPLMLIGMALYRYGLLSGTQTSRRAVRWSWIGIALGSIITLAIALAVQRGGLTYWGTIAAFSGLGPLPRLPVIIGLAVLLALWGAHAKGWLAVRFAAAGRVAFTNYLGTSIIMVLVFHPWAGGLWGDLTRPQLYLVMLAVWALMLAWPVPWLARYRYGPLEWLWRCLTYGKALPNRR